MLFARDGLYDVGRKVNERSITTTNGTSEREEIYFSTAESAHNETKIMKIHTQSISVRA